MVRPNSTETGVNENCPTGQAKSQAHEVKSVETVTVGLMPNHQKPSPPVLSLNWQKPFK
jgi:hypothetical protein